MKIVVFDLDETLGYFTQFSIFWFCLENYMVYKNNRNLTQSDFNDILDLYPEYLRPNIINILNYLKKKKHSKCCHKMMIYTNNTGSKEWSDKIVSYIEKKINYKIIDQIIAAFKVNGKIIEICRTTHSKTYNDLIKCTRIPLNAEICFIDDTFYPEMANDNIYYINVKPYYHDLQFEEIIDRFEKSQIGEKIISSDINFKDYMLEKIKKNNYKCINKEDKEYEVDKIIGKYIITHLQTFFQKTSKAKTIKKNKHNQKNKTFKN
jgi:hypothetical protein